MEGLGGNATLQIRDLAGSPVPRESRHDRRDSLLEGLSHGKTTGTNLPRPTLSLAGVETVSVIFAQVANPAEQALVLW